MKKFELNLSAEDTAHLEVLAKRLGRRPQGLAGELLAEAIRMCAVPGIVFADGPTGRRPRIEGTGVDVFEVIRAWRDMGEDERRLRNAFDWLSAEQLNAARQYHKEFPREIDEALERHDRVAARAV